MRLLPQKTLDRKQQFLHTCKNILHLHLFFCMEVGQITNIADPVQYYHDYWSIMTLHLYLLNSVSRVSDMRGPAPPLEDVTLPPSVETIMGADALMGANLLALPPHICQTIIIKWKKDNCAIYSIAKYTYCLCHSKVLGLWGPHT